MGSSYEVNSIDVFLKHKSMERGGSYLKKWNDRNPPEINTVLHMRRMPVIVWQHPLPKVMVRENKKTRQITREIWGGQYNCPEIESVLKKQYHRTDAGLRKYPSTRCPLCRLVEFVRDLVEEGKLSWVAPIFRFDSDKGPEIIHAGGIFNMYKDDDLTALELEELRTAGIRLDHAYQENVYAACKYVLCIVDADNPQDGVQIATVTSGLGDQVKEVMNDRMKSAGSEAGNPFLVPYVIQWEYRKAEAPNKKYKARFMERPVIEAVKQLIKSDPPDLSQTLQPYDHKTMRAYLERHCLINAQIDWDFVFNVVVDEEEQKNAAVVGELKAADEEPRNDSGSTEEDRCPVCSKTESEGCPHALCVCDKIILASDPKCPHCGKVYAVAAAPEAPPPAAGGRGRGRRRTGGGTDTGQVPPFAK